MVSIASVKVTKFNSEYSLLNYRSFPAIKPVDQAA